jgi:hypothetical protein
MKNPLPPTKGIFKKKRNMGAAVERNTFLGKYRFFRSLFGVGGAKKYLVI